MEIPTEATPVEAPVEAPIEAPVAATPAEAELLVEGTAATFSFREWASSLGLNRFVGLICSAGLDDYIDSCETALTIFAPSDLAIERLAQTGGLPSDMQLLRELLCVHITMGSLRHAPPVHTPLSHPRPPPAPPAPS